MLPKWSRDATKFAGQLLREMTALSHPSFNRRPTNASLGRDTVESPLSVSSRAKSRVPNAGSNRGPFASDSIVEERAASAYALHSITWPTASHTTPARVRDIRRGGNLPETQRSAPQSLSGATAAGRERLFDAHDSRQTIVQGATGAAGRAEGGLSAKAPASVLSIKVGQREAPEPRSRYDGAGRGSMPSATLEGPSQLRSNDPAASKGSQPKPSFAATARGGGVNFSTAPGPRISLRQFVRPETVAPVATENAAATAYAAQRRSLGRSDTDAFSGGISSVVASGVAGQQQPQQGNIAQSDARSTGGDVYLDGTLVGRWMERQLGRSAARQPVGSSAFDATRSRLPTGTMIGV
jgi:hypothetical protein